MAYVGNPIDTQNTFQSLVGKRFNGDGSTTAFTLDIAPSSTLDLEVFVGNVRQDPNSAYTLSGTTLTFTGAPPSGTNNIYVVHQAKSVGTIDVPDDIISGKTLVTLDNSADHVLIEDATDGELKKALIPAAPVTALNNATTSELVTVGSTTTELDAESALTYDGTTFLLTQASPIFKILPTTNGNDGVIEICGRSSDGSPTENRTRIKGEAEGSTANTKMTFHTEDSSDVNERMSISSDGIVKVNNKLVIDNTVGAAFKLNIEAGGNNESGIVLNDKDAASGFTHMGFRRSGTEIGSISRNGSNDSILFTTSSDYRLKDGIVDKTDGIEKIKLLKPRKFYWKSNADKTLVDGFLAHEVSDVVPEAISGTKDAVDENGDIIPQGIDQSNLVPLLTAALQEAVTKIETLETEMTALKARVTTLEG